MEPLLTFLKTTQLNTTITLFLISGAYIEGTFLGFNKDKNNVIMIEATHISGKATGRKIAVSLHPEKVVAWGN